MPWSNDDYLLGDPSIQARLAVPAGLWRGLAVGLPIAILGFWLPLGLAVWKPTAAYVKTRLGVHHLVAAKLHQGPVTQREDGRKVSCLRPKEQAWSGGQYLQVEEIGQQHRLATRAAHGSQSQGAAEALAVGAPALPELTFTAARAFEEGVRFHLSLLDQPPADGGQVLGGPHAAASPLDGRVSLRR
jgi:hypothetical protein